MIAAFPLQWPSGWPRTEPRQRKSANFARHETSYAPEGKKTVRRGLTVFDGVERVLDELARLSIDRQDVVVSTNVRTRLDGLPRSGEPKPDDPGAAVYWQKDSEPPRVMAIDRYDEVADNLAAIALTLASLRAIERHGGGRILERAFTGFTALPAPGNTSRNWRQVFGIGDAEITKDQAERIYRTLASRMHPDRGGSNDQMADLNWAREQAMQELRA